MIKVENKGQGQKPEAPKAPPAPPAPLVLSMIPGLEPKALAGRMGISPKRLRSILRADHPRQPDVRGKRWSIPMDLAKKVEADYKAKQAKAEAEKQAQIQKELAGEAKV